MTPFLLLEYKIVIPVMIGEFDSYAALDTGSCSNYISMELADKFVREGASRAKGLFSEAEFSTVSVPKVEMLDQTFRDVMMSASESMAGEMKNDALVMDAIIGTDVLLDQPIVLDFIRLQIGRNIEAIERYESLPSVFRGGLPFVYAGWGSKVVRALVDLGAGISVVNSGRGNVFLQNEVPLYELEIDDILGGSRTEKIYRMNHLKMGRSASFDSDFIACDLTTFESSLGTEIDIIVGTNHLVKSNCVWLIDRVNERICFSELPTGGDDKKANV